MLMSILGNAILQAKLKIQAKMLKRAKDKGNAAAETEWAARLARTEKRRDAYIKFQNAIEDALSKYSKDTKKVKADTANGKIAHKAGVEIKIIQSLVHATKASVNNVRQRIENYKTDTEQTDVICEIIAESKEIKEVTNKGGVRTKISKGINGDVKEAQKINTGLYLVEYVDTNNRAATALVHYNGKTVEILANITSLTNRNRIQKAVNDVKNGRVKSGKKRAQNKKYDKLYETLNRVRSRR